MAITNRVLSAPTRDPFRYDPHRRPALNDGDRDISKMKILIASPPKTGNTWVKQLLSTIYDMPIAFVGNTLDTAPETMEGLGKRWIAHQHWAPTPALLRWRQENGLIVITTLRHPGDTLVSLYHYLRTYADLFRGTANDMVTLMNLDRMASSPPDDEKKIGKHLLWYVQEWFQYELESSLLWLRSPETLAVRYEDLWRDPLTALTQLTDRISPVSRDCIERAIEACTIGLMRSMAGQNHRFFRQGGVGGWRMDLPPEALAMLRTVEPYPTYTALLGYTFDLDDPLTTAPAKAWTFHNPFRGATHFDMGVPIAPILVRLYLSVPSAASTRWASPSSTASEDSFFAWANARADDDPSIDRSLPTITNLAAYIYRLRADVQCMFPDPFGADRRAYARWFVVHARGMYTLDRAFIAPVLEGIRDWLNAPAEDDSRRDEAALAVTNIARYLYDLRRDIHPLFPELFGQHRLPFARWFVEYGRADFSLDETLAPLTTTNSAQGDHPGATPYEWMETLRLSEEMLAAEREATHRYVTALQHDRNSLHEYVMTVEEDRNKVRDYLASVEEDRRNVRAYLASVEQDRISVRDYLLSVEEDRNNLRRYLTSMEQDRDNLRDYLMAVEEDRGNVRAYLIAVEEDRDNVRAYLTRVEQDRNNLHTYVVAVEEDRNNVRRYQEDLQREYERVRAVAAEQEQALTVAYAAIEGIERTVREREAEVERLHGEVQTLQVRIERFSLRRLLRRLRDVAPPHGHVIVRRLLNSGASRR